MLFNRWFGWNIGGLFSPEFVDMPWSWALAGIVSGETITAIVLGLETTGPLLFRALLAQDMYLAGSITMLLTFMVVIGTFISDMLLVLIDPRIRYEALAS